ncbi:MAG: gluconokinase [Infirmifilum sp.]
MPFLAADLGTTTLKIGIVDENLNFLHFLSKEVPIIRKEAGAAEHDPEGLLHLFLDLSRRVLSEVNTEISGIVLSGYLFGLVALDSNGTPLTGIMTWLDRRPVEVLEEIYLKLPPSLVYQRTGCPPLFIYQLPKIFWIAKRKPLLYNKTACFLDAKGYLIYRLTGRRIMEKSSASGSQLMNLQTTEWDEELIGELGLEVNKLPELVEPIDIIGELDNEIANLLGLKSSVPVIPGIFDGGSVTVGEGALNESIGSSHLSTSTMIRVASKYPVIDRSGKMRFQTYYAFKGVWLPGGALNNAGIVLRWYRDTFGALEKIVSEDTGLDIFELLTFEAQQAPPGSDGLVFLPFLSGERIPEFGNSASAVLFGLRENHTNRHVIRSFMEGIAFNLKTVKEALEENSLKINELRITGGGAKSDLWLQIISDVLEIPVHRVYALDAALAGATIIGMKALGKIDDIREYSARNVKIGKSFAPNEDNIKTYRRSYRIYKELLNQIKPLFLESGID